MGSRSIYDIIIGNEDNQPAVSEEVINPSNPGEAEPEPQPSPVWSVVDSMESEETGRYASNVFDGAKVAWGEHRQSFEEFGDEYNVDPYILAALAGKESGGRADAVGPTNDLGLMQFTPATWNEVMPGYSLDERLNPELSIQAAAKYLDKLRTWAGGDIDTAVQSYNAGIGRVKKAIRNKDPLSGHTRYYLPSVISGRDQLQSWAVENTTSKGFWGRFLQELEEEIK